VAAWVLSGEGTILAGVAGESPAHCEQGSLRAQTPAFGVATWEVTLSARKVVMCVFLAGNWYYCAQFIAKPKAACALRFSWAAR